MAQIFVIALLISLFITAKGVERIVAKQGVVIRIGATAWLYGAVTLLTFPGQAASGPREMSDLSPQSGSKRTLIYQP
jgi:hypothetical protein